MDHRELVDYNITRDHVPLDFQPTRLHTRRAVEAWHARRVISDSYTYQEAADRLGVSKKTLWEMRKRHNITEQPKREE